MNRIPRFKTQTAATMKHPFDSPDPDLPIQGDPAVMGRDVAVHLAKSVRFFGVPVLVGFKGTPTGHPAFFGGPPF